MIGRLPALLLALLLALPAAAQTGPGLRPPQGTDQPVTFTAGEVEYDERNDTVTARGGVEAWQSGRTLRADRITWNRRTGIAVAEGNVVVIEPDGQTYFADRAELSEGFRDGVVENMAGRLADNARFVAAGGRRTAGNITDMARVVYSSCDLCPDDPTRPPLWQLRARLATHDREAQRIRFRDASMDIAGVPVLWTPYLSVPDPSAPRQSGFLTPSFGASRRLGAFLEIPYYWAIDDSQDLTLSPLLSTRLLPHLGASWRRRFNAGEIAVSGSVGDLERVSTRGETGLGGHVFARGRFSLDETWRAGFDLNRASSESYLRAYRYEAPRVLPTTAFLEGFWGASGYARADVRAYQSLRALDDIARTPFVLPNLYGEWHGQDGWGGFLTLDAGAFSILRRSGTDTRRAAARATYERPFLDPVGSLWTLRGQADAIAYAADRLDLAPNFSDVTSVSGVRGNIRLALDWRLPLIRPDGAGGSQILEPRVQLVTGPGTGRQTRLPNEDSLDFEFTDATLFALNRFPGRDRLEGGTRLDAGLRAAWLLAGGRGAEAFLGRSLRLAGGSSFEPGSGLERRASDWVGRLSLQPTSWLDLTGRARFDGERLDTRLLDGTATLSLGRVTLSGGYLQTYPLAQLAPVQARREVSAGVSARITDTWRASVFGRYDLALRRGVSVGLSATYEDECLVFDVRFTRRFAEDPLTGREYTSGTTLLFRIGFKTVGDLGLRLL
ncbi:MAG: LPS-assembly protein LptD [Elioraea tepidiphila]